MPQFMLICILPFFQCEELCTKEPCIRNIEFNQSSMDFYLDVQDWHSCLLAHKDLRCEQSLENLGSAI